MASTGDNVKRVVIDPVSRVEGHGKVSILIDKHNRVSECRFHLVEFRGFERFIRGRLFWEIPVIAERLCGICPVSHHLAAAKAMDLIVGVDRLTPTAEKIRRLMHHAQILQSNATHFFYLASPDLLFGPGGDAAQRNIVGVLAKNPELARQGILIRKFGQEIIKVTSGKRVHGTGAVPGGVNKSLTVPERDLFLESMPKILEWSARAVEFIKDYTLENRELTQTLGQVESNFLSLVRGDGVMDLYDGNLRAVSPDGASLFSNVPVSEYAALIREEVRSWSYCKFPFLAKLGPEKGWYRVGPLARMNTCSSIDTPLAEAARREFSAEASASSGRPGQFTMWYHWARMIESLHAAEKISELLHDRDLLRGDLFAPRGERREEAVAAIEAPRGTLFHHYRVDRNDQVTMANLMVSTTQNNEAMNRTVKSVVGEYIDGKPAITAAMLDRIEMAIRAYDPCLSCATHAIGSMPLAVELYDCGGGLLQRVERG